MKRAQTGGGVSREEHARALRQMYELARVVTVLARRLGREVRVPLSELNAALPPLGLERTDAELVVSLGDEPVRPAGDLLRDAGGVP